MKPATLFTDSNEAAAIARLLRACLAITTPLNLPPYRWWT